MREHLQIYVHEKYDSLYTSIYESLEGPLLKKKKNISL